MPSRKQLTSEIAHYTDSLFAQIYLLNKPHYKDAEYNLIMCQALVAYHEMPLVDEFLSKINHTTTNVSAVWIRDTLREVWSNKDLRTQLQLNVIMQLHNVQKASTIGRNQLITLLLACIKEQTNG